MATTATLKPTHVNLHVGVAPRSFTPPGDRSARLSHLDPRPLWQEDEAVVSAWKSGTFWAAYALVAPVFGLSRLSRR